MKKQLLLISILLTLTFCVNAQDCKTSIDFSANLTSRYIVNGTDLGKHSPAIQPNAEISVGDFTFGLWGSFALNVANANETDWYLRYKIKNFLSIQFSDVFFSNDTLKSNNYLNYNKKTTGHQLNASINLLGTEEIPLGIHFDFFFYTSIDLDKNGKDRFTSYFELNYALKLQNIDIKPFLGFTPWEGYWGNRFGVVNTGLAFSKNIPITEKYSLPINCKFIINPQAENVFFVFGISLR